VARKFQTASLQALEKRKSPNLRKRVSNMCATCGCGKPKDKHGMKSLKDANKKFAKKAATKAPAKKAVMNRKKGM
jgi:hypothetical protein